MRSAPPPKPAARPARRPSPAASEAVLLALAGGISPFVQLVTGEGAGAALTLAGAVSVVRRRDRGLTVKERGTDGRWRSTVACAGLAMIDCAALIEYALNRAVALHLATAGGGALPSLDRLYAEKRLRTDLYPSAHSARTARAVRQLLLREVADRAVLRATGLIFGRAASFGDYNDVVRAEADTLVRITSETPNLASLLREPVRQLARKGGGHAEPGLVGAVRHALTHAVPAARLAPRDWKWLSHQALGTVGALVRPVASEEAARLDTLAVRLFAAAGVLRPPATLLALAAPGGALERALDTVRGDPQGERLTDLARLTRLAAQEWQRRAEAGRGSRFVRDDLAYLIDWWIDESASGAPLVPHNATYPSLIRRQQRWHQMVILEYPEYLQQWKSVVPAHESMGVRAVPLTDSLMLAREGMEMRHCVASYARDCAGGNTRIFALEAAAGGERATLELRRRASVWFAGQLKGPCNAEVSIELRIAAERLAARYTRAEYPH